MASQMIIAPSVDTLFMRGFSTKQDIQKIRQFFDHEAGGNGCTVEFFKESEQYSKLFVALRFDSKEVAKDILNKFDNTDVMGDRITISWFKDLRKARQKGVDVNGYYGNRSYGQYNRGGGFGYRRGGGGGWGRGGGYHSRGMSRPYYPQHRDRDYRSASRSRSRSRSRSHSYSRSRSRSRGRDRSRSYRSHSRSRSRTRSKSPPSRHSTPSRTRSKTPEKKKKKKSRKQSKEKREEEFVPRSPSPEPRSAGYDDVPDALWEEEHNRLKEPGSPEQYDGSPPPPPPPPKSNKHVRSTVKSVKEEYSDGEGYGNNYYEKDAAHKRKTRSPSPMSEDPLLEQYDESEYDRKKGGKDSKRSRGGEGYDDDQQYIHDEARSEKKRRKYAEDDMSPGRSSKSESVDKGRSSMRRDRSPFDGLDQGGVNGITDGMDRGGGALGLPQDKMALVREKKEEIEKAYRQDCETFSAVVKMLISKNPELEDHLQDSLRDNLKDIGQRCIQELREFIESLKVQETMH